MKIEIDIESEEAKNIIKEYVLKQFPIDMIGKEILVSGSYGSFTVEITDKPEQADKEVANET